MDNRPILMVMAAGLGSRYGGLKQIAPVDDMGQILTDYSLYDAKKAGFERVVFIIAREKEQDFRQVIGDRIARHLEVRYAYQSIDALPAGFSVPEGRIKPWGTGHAVLCAKPLADANFAVINADDYYGADAFKTIYSFLKNEARDDLHAMVGYEISNTLTEHGSVARGVCAVSNGYLTGITERTRIEKRPGGAAYTEDGENFSLLSADTIVSMNLWGFGLSMMDELEQRFAPFLEQNLPRDPQKCEYYLPAAVNDLLREGKANVKMLTCGDKWYGITYAADMPRVKEALAGMRAEGKYPGRLWEE